MYYYYFQLLLKYESTSHGNKKPVFHQSQYIQSVLKFEILIEYVLRTFCISRKNSIILN